MLAPSVKPPIRSNQSGCTKWCSVTTGFRLLLEAQGTLLSTLQQHPSCAAGAKGTCAQGPLQHILNSIDSAQSVLSHLLAQQCLSHANALNGCLLAFYSVQQSFGGIKHAQLL